jgi:hypothetical protein
MLTAASLAILTFGSALGANHSTVQSSLSVDYVSCESGDSRFSCAAGISGGSGTVTVSWRAIGGTIDESGPEQVAGSCTPAHKVTVTAVATDSSGATASRSGSTICQLIWPSAGLGR